MSIYLDKTSQTLDNHLINFMEVSFKYSTQLVLENITFSINKGDFLYITGPNGAGKSTLINLIIGSIKPSFGIVECNFKKIGFLPQLSSHKEFFPISVLEVIYSGFTKQSLFISKKDRLLIEEYLLKMDLKEFLHESFSNLSGGQKQRVLLIRALISEPDVLILDEPTSALDVDFKTKFIKILQAINQHGTTIIYITHDHHDAMLPQMKLLQIDKKIISYGLTNNEECGCHV